MATGTLGKMDILNKIMTKTDFKPSANSSSSARDLKAEDTSSKFPLPNKPIKESPADPKNIEQKPVSSTESVDVKDKKSSLLSKSEKKTSEAQSEDRVTRKKALEVFAEKMQNEFNINAEEVIIAFSKMDPEKLAEAPALSASEFIDQLPIADGEKAKALEIYTEMLSWTAAAGVTDELGSKGQTANIKVLTQDELALQNRLKKLNTLSEKFFMDGQFSRKATQATTIEMPMDANAKTVGSANQMAMTDAQLTEGEQILESLGFDVKQATSADLEGVDVNQLDANSLDLEMPLDVEANSLETTNVTVEEAANSLDAMEVAPDAEIENIENMLKGMTKNSNVEVAEEGISVANKNAASSLSSESDSESMEGDINQQDMRGLGIENNKNSNTGKSEFAKMMNPPSKAEMNENVTNIMNRAQSLVRDGGGEMKIRLNPEGLGEVALKVSVNKGEVQIEMLATNDSTKKLLEKGLVDLKESLMSHKLQVDNIKVETTQQTMNDFLADQRESAEKQFQQKFLQDFMRNNQERRGGLLNGFGSVQRPSSQTQDEAINGLYDASSRRANSDRKLDLVA